MDGFQTGSGTRKCEKINLKIEALNNLAELIVKFFKEHNSIAFVGNVCHWFFPVAFFDLHMATIYFYGEAIIAGTGESH